MALYIHQASYTSDSLSAQIKNPEDRMNVAARPAIEAAGGKLVAGGYSFGDYDICFIFEAPTEVAAASVAIALSAGGAIRAARTSRLLSGAEWVEALQGTHTVREVYRPALDREFIPHEESLMASEGYAPEQ